MHLFAVVPRVGGSGMIRSSLPWLPAAPAPEHAVDETGRTLAWATPSFTARPAGARSSPGARIL